MRRTAPAILVLAILSGCIAMPERNEALGVDPRAAAEEHERLRRETAPLPRPVVVINGYHALPSAAARLARQLAEATCDDPSNFLAVSHTFESDIDRITARVIERVEARWPSDDPEATVEIDVVAISMGGIVAQWAALPPAERRRGDDPAPNATGKRLRIARLFTLATPHRGAILAELLAPDAAARDMVPGSALLRTLDSHRETCPYELVCYAQLRDGIVGATRAAPEGHPVIWTSGTLLGSHLMVGDNPLFIADIAKRLRGEPPLLSPGGPPPCD